MACLNMLRYVLVVSYLISRRYGTSHYILQYHNMIRVSFIIVYRTSQLEHIGLTLFMTSCMTFFCFGLGTSKEGDCMCGLLQPGSSGEKLHYHECVFAHSLVLRLCRLRSGNVFLPMEFK